MNVTTSAMHLERIALEKWTLEESGVKCATFFIGFVEE